MGQRALLIIDMLKDFIDKKGVLYVGEQGKRIIDPINLLLKKEREEDSLVFYICDNHSENDAEFEMFPTHCVNGTSGAEIIPELSPQQEDYIVKKRRYSAFAGTDLDIAFRENNVDELVLVGVCTNICVLYTAADARNLNYKVKVYEQGVTSFDLDAHNFALQEMKNTLGVSIL